MENLDYHTEMNLAKTVGSVLAGTVMGVATWGALNFENRGIDQKIQQLNVEIGSKQEVIPFEKEAAFVGRAKQILSPDEWIRLEPSAAILKLDNLANTLSDGAFLKFTNSNPSEYSSAIKNIADFKATVTQFSMQWPANAQGWYAFLSGGYQAEVPHLIPHSKEFPIEISGRIGNRNASFRGGIQGVEYEQINAPRLGGSAQAMISAASRFISIADLSYSTSRSNAMRNNGAIIKIHQQEIRALKENKYGMQIPLTAGLIGLIGTFGLLSFPRERYGMSREIYDSVPQNRHAYNRGYIDKTGRHCVGLSDGR